MHIRATFTEIIHLLHHNDLSSQTHPFSDHTSYNLISFPTEILCMIDNYLPPIDGLSLRVTCHTLFARLPRFKPSQLGPDSLNIISSTLHFWKICTLERQCLLVNSKEISMVRKPHRTISRHRDRQRACSYCLDAHPKEYFSKNQLRQRPEARICIGAEKPLRFCKHRSTSHAELLEYAKTAKPAHLWYNSFMDYPIFMIHEPCFHRIDLFLEDRLILHHDLQNHGQIRLEHLFRFRRVSSFTKGMTFLFNAWDYIWEHEHLCPRISRKKARLWFNIALKEFSESGTYGSEVSGLSCGESRCGCNYTLILEVPPEIKLLESRFLYPFEGPTSKAWIEELGVKKLLEIML